MWAVLCNVSISPTEQDGVFMTASILGFDSPVVVTSVGRLVEGLVSATLPTKEGLFPRDLNSSLAILDGTISWMVCAKYTHTYA